MRRFLAFWAAMLMLLLLCSCRTAHNTIEEVPVEVQVPVLVHDTIVSYAIRVDSTHVHDSIYVTPEKEYREKTVYKYRLLHDTLYMVRTDTICIQKPVTITKYKTEVIKPRWYENAAKWVGYLCCIALILWLLFLYIMKRK